MNLLQELENMEVNVQEALDRVMGDADLFELMLGMFVDVVEEKPIELADFDAPDLDELIKHVHTLKGTTGNLSIMPLYEGYNKILGLLRNSQPHPAKELMAELLPVQAKIIECIKKYR